MEEAGVLARAGNLCDRGILKSSVISDGFRARCLARPGHEGVFEGRAIVFDGSDDYHYRTNDPALAIDEDCILVIRGAGPIGATGSDALVTMKPPAGLLRRGTDWLTTSSGRRQQGTSHSADTHNVRTDSPHGPPSYRGHTGT